jgi:glycolate oxidase FAD binding subunit
VAEFPSPSSHPGGVVCRVGGPLARWADVVQALDASRDIAGPVEILVHAGVGLLYCACGAESGMPLADALGRAAAQMGGYAVVESAPPAVKARLPVWGASPGGLDLMRRLREKFDPRGIMIPGRLGWGLS